MWGRCLRNTRMSKCHPPISKGWGSAVYLRASHIRVWVPWASSVTMQSVLHFGWDICVLAEYARPWWPDLCLPLQPQLPSLDPATAGQSRMFLAFAPDFPPSPWPLTCWDPHPPHSYIPPSHLRLRPKVISLLKPALRYPFPPFQNLLSPPLCSISPLSVIVLDDICLPAPDQTVTALSLLRHFT